MSAMESASLAVQETHLARLIERFTARPRVLRSLYALRIRSGA